MAEKNMSDTLSDADLKEIKELDRRFMNAMISKNLDATMDCFHDGPELSLILWGNEYRGHEAARAAMKELFDRNETIDVEVQEVSHIKTGDGVLGIGKATYKVKPINGEPKLMVERWCDLRRKINGRWVYVMDHASEIPKERTI